MRKIFIFLFVFLEILYSESSNVDICTTYQNDYTGNPYKIKIENLGNNNLLISDKYIAKWNKKKKRYEYEILKGVYLIPLSKNRLLLQNKKTGYGAGSRELSFPNVLRIILGEMKEERFENDKVTIIKTNIDDMNPQIYSNLMDDLFNIGALDVHLNQIIMKKNRPAVELAVISPKDRTEKILDKLFRETTSFGVRLQEVGRKKLIREIVNVKTEYGNVNVKLGYMDNEVIKISPEYEDCARMASARDVALRTVYEEARAAASGGDG